MPALGWRKTSALCKAESVRSFFAATLYRYIPAAQALTASCAPAMLEAHGISTSTGS
jgi:hypothetical protein